jgi:hypothetical protein
MQRSQHDQFHIGRHDADQHHQKYQENTGCHGTRGRDGDRVHAQANTRTPKGNSSFVRRPNITEPSLFVAV